jgi:hypothetical protein
MCIFKLQYMNKCSIIICICIITIWCTPLPHLIYTVAIDLMGFLKV